MSTLLRGDDKCPFVIAVQQGYRLNFGDGALTKNNNNNNNNSNYDDDDDYYYYYYVHDEL